VVHINYSSRLLKASRSWYGSVRFGGRLAFFRAKFRENSRHSAVVAGPRAVADFVVDVVGRGGAEGGDVAERVVRNGRPSRR